MGMASEPPINIWSKGLIPLGGVGFICQTDG